MSELHLKGYMKESDREQFAQDLQNLNYLTSSKVSARGWCYILEGQNIIDKGKFKRVEKLINDCRKEGFLPIDFTATDNTRVANNLDLDLTNTETPGDFLKNRLDWLKNVENDYDAVSFWDSQEYYLEIWVEKIDLKNLFQPVCYEYKIPIATTRGWYSINQRYRAARRLKEKQDQGKKVRLLYFGDFDPKGV